LDAEKIHAKAIEKNLVPENKVLSEGEIADLIFAPGFSTAAAVTEISGRGVGLDAVKNSIENAGGLISVKSKSGKGATFEIFLPQNFESQKLGNAETNDGSDKI
jgi:two-component system chemotaxis sensor kinase CheA